MKKALAILLFLIFQLSTHAGTTTHEALATIPAASVQAVQLPRETASFTIAAGVQWRQLGKASFHGRFEASTADIPGFSNDSANHGIYADGYVLRDISGSNTSWNWGFDHASQVSDGTLALHRGVVTPASASATSSEEIAGWGGFIEIETSPVLNMPPCQLSFAAGYSFARDDMSTAESSVPLHWPAFVDTFDVSSALPLPSGVHHGTFNGPGPIIPDQPLSHTTASGAEGFFASQLEHRLDVRLHTISVGPRIGFASGSLRVISGFGYAFNIASYDAQTHEVFTRGDGMTIRHWHHHHGGTRALSGLYLQGGAEWRVRPHWLLFASTRYDWSQDLKGHVGASAFNLDLGGWTAMLGLARQF